MRLTNVVVSKNGEPKIEGADGETRDGLVSVKAEDPGFTVGEMLQITGDPGFSSPATYIDENSGKLNFKIV